MKKTLTRTIALAMVLLMALALAAPALAASKQMITTASAQVRSSPAQVTTNVIGNLVKGEVVTQTGTTGIWSIIDYKGVTAYVLSSRLKTYTGTGGTTSSGSGTSSGEGGSATATTVYTTGTVNVRKGPGTNYSKVGQLSKGTAVNKVGSTGNWALIEWNDGVAYVSLNYLTSSGGGSSSGGTTSGNVMMATANVNVRSGAGTNYSIVGWLAKGETVTKTGTSGKWTKINYNGSTAYVSSAYLKATGSSTDSGSGSNTGGGTTTQTLLAARYETAVRTGPSSSNRAIGYLDIGQTVVYLDTYGSWYKVQYGSHTSAYVYGPDMRWVGSSSSGGSVASGYVYATNSSVRVYASASTSSSTLGYLYAGDSAERTGIVGSFTRIDFGGVAGYVLTSQVTTGSSNTSGMTSIRAWMYSRYSRAVCYTAPIESSSYVHGYLGYAERVWAVEGNSQWTKIQVSGYTLYTRSSNLAYSYPGTGGSGSWSGVYVYADTPMWENYQLTVALNTTTTGQQVVIPMYGEVTVLSYIPDDNFAWVRYGSYVGYIRYSAIRATYNP